MNVSVLWIQKSPCRFGVCEPTVGIGRPLMRGLLM